MLSMTWLRVTCLVLAAPLLACSNDDSGTSPGQVQPGSQPPATKFEAGAPCLTVNDCQAGLACRYPAPGCQLSKVCAPTPPSDCVQQPACSCLEETVQVCDGYADDPIDSLGACADAGFIVPSDGGGGDSTVTDSGPGGMSDGGDATTASDSGGNVDAADASLD